MPKVQREYIDYFVAKAKTKALENPAALLYDPQGRVLINVSLTPEERIQAAEQLGHEPTETTTVSLDVFGDDSLKSLKTAYQAQYGLSDQQLEQFESLDSARGSIIPLQQEFHFHIGLAARTYTKADPVRFPEEKMMNAHYEAMHKIHPLITEQFKSALAKATKSDGAIDEIKLIQGLDKARKNIFAQAHRILLVETVRATGVRLTKEELKALDLKHKAEITTASANDLVHTDATLGQTTWIAGTEVTAHDRGVGAEKLADRQIVTIPHNELHQERPRIQIRTPSLDVKEKITAQAAVADVKEKLEHVKEKYALQENITANALGRKALIYNLYTALNDSLEGGKNKQSQGARYILEAAHKYNADEALKGDAGVFCFVQNISVNGFGDSLGYGGNDLKTEATLMAEMAMLHNLVSKTDTKNPDVLMVFNKYSQFLSKDGPREPFFSQSAEGKEAIEAIKKVKADWVAADRDIPEGASAVEQAKMALKSMMADELHHQHEYAKLFQALSVFTEEASIGGCKSGNERAQAINGRVAILDSVAHKADDPIVKAIGELAKAAPGQVAERATALKSALNTKYDHNLQSAVSLISAADQGAAAKVNAKRGLAGLYNRNYAEDSTLEHLHQDKAGKMQAHKGLTKEMSAAHDGPEPKGFFAYMSSKIGVIGVVLATLVAPIAYPIAAAFHNQYKKDEHAKFQSILNDAQSSFKAAIIVPSHEIVQAEPGIQDGADRKDVPNPSLNWNKISKNKWESGVSGKPVQVQLCMTDVEEHVGRFKETLEKIKEEGGKITPEQAQITVDEVRSIGPSQ